MPEKAGKAGKAGMCFSSAKLNNQRTGCARSVLLFSTSTTRSRSLSYGTDGDQEVFDQLFLRFKWIIHCQVLNIHPLTLNHYTTTNASLIINL